MKIKTRVVQTGENDFIPQLSVDDGANWVDLMIYATGSAHARIESERVFAAAIRRPSKGKVIFCTLSPEFGNTDDGDQIE